jgi:hypothetical protein
MVVKYQGGESTYFPGFTTSDSTIEFLEPSEVARRVLKNRRELALLELPSVMRVAEILANGFADPTCGFEMRSPPLIDLGAKCATVT